MRYAWSMYLFWPSTVASATTSVARAALDLEFNPSAAFSFMLAEAPLLLRPKAVWRTSTDFLSMSKAFGLRFRFRKGTVCEYDFDMSMFDCVSPLTNQFVCERQMLVLLEGRACPPDQQPSPSPKHSTDTCPSSFFRLLLGRLGAYSDMRARESAC